MNIKSQREEILSWLRRGKTLDPLTALERFGVFRLSGRILELRQQGHEIETVMVEKNGKRFAQYKLINSI